eukprot:4192198-Prorocentrum_lima.AAC.1
MRGRSCSRGDPQVPVPRRAALPLAASSHHHLPKTEPRTKTEPHQDGAAHRDGTTHHGGTATQ